MFKKLKEKQSLINESRTALANTEKKIKELVRPQINTNSK